VGATYAQLGERDNAMRWLEQAARTGLPCYPWYERDPLLDPLRSNAEFHRFLGDMRRSWEALKAKYPAGR
jgi:hypothetical protein